jgi:D-glycero-D-manno-heptose 1,7-bisphosphate phosphatase
MSSGLRRAVFFDRDDTLMWNVPYLADPAQVKVIPDAAATLRSLAKKDVELFVVSNQSGVGRGLVTREQLAAVNAEMEKQLGASHFRALYHSYGDPGKGGPDLRHRKPSPQLLFEAARDHGVALRRSFFVGDRLSDVLCGRNAGCRTVLVRTGENGAEWARAARFADHAADSLAEVGKWIETELAKDA